MRRGTTLVELMVTVAMVGILGGFAVGLAQFTERAALGEVLRARARVLLDYHARQVSLGQPVDPEVEARLEASLPRARVQQARAGKATTLTVSWRTPSEADASLALTVLAGEAR